MNNKFNLLRTLLMTDTSPEEGREKLRGRLQAILDWADFALQNPGEFDGHGVRNLDGPVFDAARAVLAETPAIAKALLPNAKGDGGEEEGLTRSRDLSHAARYAIEAIDSGRSEPLFIARRALRNALEDLTRAGAGASGEGPPTAAQSVAGKARPSDCRDPMRCTMRHMETEPPTDYWFCSTPRCPHAIVPLAEGAP